MHRNNAPASGSDRDRHRAQREGRRRPTMSKKDRRPASRTRKDNRRQGAVRRAQSHQRCKFGSDAIHTYGTIDPREPFLSLALSLTVGMAPLSLEAASIRLNRVVRLSVYPCACVTVCPLRVVLWILRFAFMIQTAATGQTLF